MKRLSVIYSGTILGSMIFLAASAQAAGDDNLNPKELVNLSLEQLSNIEITSVSKKTEKASEAAAAIFVITQDDIKRSGMTSIPELLRMVPGLSVAQSGSHQWSITSRGTSGQFANKLLVLIDGRTVYTPIFSGVFWDIQDVMLEDIERIEVIRGPGATLWGANAVNGVINIITKSAKDTVGGVVSQTAGNVDKSLTDVRYGAKVGDNDYGRVYAKYDDRAAVDTLSGRSAKDDWNKVQSGFRTDGGQDDVTFTLQGDGYRAGERLTRSFPTLGASDVLHENEIATGANLLGRVNYKQSDTSQWSLQMYVDNTERSSLNFNDVTINTFDVDLQNTWTASERHEVVWGVGYRLISQDSEGTLYSYFTPANRLDNLFNAFVQDKITLVPKTFFLTLGSKFEHNAYSGFETQPSARLSWLIDDKQTWWSSVSHAVRTPNLFSADGSLVLGSVPGTYYVAAEPNKSNVSEELNAYETGYRIQPTKKLSFDFTTYINKYSKLITSENGGFHMIDIPGVGLTPVVSVIPVNGNSGTSTGAEIAANWEVTSNWQLAASYTRLNFVLNHPEQPGFTIKGFSPKDQANLRSTLSLPHDVELTNALYYVDKLAGPHIPSYIRFDSRIAWKAMDNMEISFVGQNLFDNAHQEYTGFVYQADSQIPRTFYGNITWKF